MLRTVKLLVLFMGVLILAALGVLAYGMMYAKKDPAVKTAPAEVGQAPAPLVAAPVGGGGPGFGLVALGEPQGSSVAAAQVAGGLLLLTVTGGGVADRVVLLDVASGREVGRVVLGAGR